MLDDGESVGPIRRISSHFSFRGARGILTGQHPCDQRLEPLGCLGDLGWYTIRFTLWAMNYQMPRHVTRTDLTASASARQPSRRADGILCRVVLPRRRFGDLLLLVRHRESTVGQHQRKQGLCTADDFVLPFFGCEAAFELVVSNLDRSGCTYNMPRRTERIASPEYSNNHPTAQETGMFRRFSSIVLSGRLEPEWEKIALATQKVVNACFESAKNDGKKVSL